VALQGRLAHRTYVRYSWGVDEHTTSEAIIACCWLPNFPLRIIAHGACGLDEPVALAAEGAAHPVVLDCTDAARDFGVEAGMLVSRAMGCCAQLRVVSCDVPRVEAAAERFVQRLEALGAAVQPMEPGRVFFDAAPLLRLYGGLAGVFERVLGSFGSDAVRVGAGPNPFVAWVATRHATPRGWLRVEPGEARRMLERMPLGLLPAGPELVKLLHALGLQTLGDIASLDVHQVADRFGADGMRLHALARGEDDSRLEPRVPMEPVAELLAFPEPVANDLTLRSAIEMLAERLAAHPRCVLHAPRTVLITCVLASGTSWQARRVLRVPTIDARRIALAIAPALGEVPAAVERMELALEGFTPRAADQRTLLADDEEATLDRRNRSMRHVQETIGEDALLQVLEVEPWSRVPERHAVLVPRRAMQLDPTVEAGRGVWK
ncbi:MAG: hypothetical protein JWO69_1662, partial [Thermoleophilia bacterium]|nr:hypothetical protein [Thermoleophilia bacterium]